MLELAVVTLFPDFFESPLAVGVIRRALESGALSVEAVDLRRWGKGTHRHVDDAPYGGGPGMILMADPLASALEGREDSHRVLLTPVGQPLNQKKLDNWAEMAKLTLVCGRYQGVDERFVEEFIDEEVSLGDFVLAGGEVAALAVIEGVARLIPGVLGNHGSLENESFRDSLLAAPQYTRPAIFRDRAVPEVLLSGDHGRIKKWRHDQRIARTRQRRPDLLRPDEASS